MSSAVLHERVVESVETSLADFIPGINLSSLRAMGGDDFYSIVAGVRYKLREAVSPELVVELHSQGRVEEIGRRAQRCVTFDNLLRQFESGQ